MSIQKKQLTIGLFGFGVVGEGLYQVLNQTKTLNAQIKKVCIKHPDKKRNAPAELFTTNANELLKDDSINLIVELIDDADAALSIARNALQAGKAVVSANKKLVAENLPELIALQEQYNTPLLYEAACCASIPVIRNLEEYYDNDLLQGVSGILNGSTNYILTKIFEEQKTFAEALKEAQEAGFAESDPTLDIAGIDAVNKLAIVLAHAYGVIAHPNELLYNGIESIKATDAVYAQEKGYQIKLIAQAYKTDADSIAAFVLPQFVKRDSQLYGVRNEFNGVAIKSGLAEEQFFYGKGAGSFPTASAVLSDISALSYDYRYEYKKKNRANIPELQSDYYLNVYVSFDELNKVDKSKFATIHTWSSSAEGHYIIGTIHHNELKDTGWWKAEGVSLILLPEAIEKEVSKKKSVAELELV